jgi:hypothetical protein
VRDADLSYLQRGFRQLPLADALEVYEAASPDERGGLRALLANKAANAQVTGPQADALRTRLQKAVALPVAGLPKSPRAAMPVAPRSQ